MPSETRPKTVHMLIFVDISKLQTRIPWICDAHGCMTLGLVFKNSLTKLVISADPDCDSYKTEAPSAAIRKSDLPSGDILIACARFQAFSVHVSNVRYNSCTPIFMIVRCSCPPRIMQQQCLACIFSHESALSEHVSS